MSRWYGGTLAQLPLELRDKLELINLLCKLQYLYMCLEHHKISLVKLFCVVDKEELQHGSPASKIQEDVLVEGVEEAQQAVDPSRV